MSNTKEGGLKAAATNKAKHGDDFYKRIGSIGGSVRNPNKGFGHDKRNILEKIFLRPKTATRAGRIGGKISKRGKAIA
jgi:uncharacterized protein